MPHTNKQALTKLVLDEAIAAVAEQEFNRLRRITNDDVQLAENVNAALDSLAKLQYGVKPEYNEWDALFYLTWYQPRQINLALTILPGLYEDARTDLGANFSLHIIDVGYGALAIQFAMAILATEYQLEGKDVTGEGFRFNKLDSAELKFHGELRETTEWRRCLVNRLRENPLNSVAGLLFSPVEWAPHNHKTTLCKILGGG